VVVRAGGAEARIEDLRVERTARATTVARADGAVHVETVEHLFAALAGLGVRAGLAIDVDGTELPLLDGGALAWARAVASLALPWGAPSLVVARNEVISIGPSLYSFERAGNELTVVFDTDDPRLVRHASWSGDPDDFVARIAAARTFAFARDVPDLAARGLASHVAPESVVVVADEAIHAAGAPFSADEPVRHKLLDLMGDLYVYGGPPRGTIHATRPGHTSTHAALARALATGVLSRREGRARGSEGTARTR
jgi:UDP-3-O-[3-hydroxymyristoyl] N-acetylglucosamine deacetylase